MNKLWGGYLLYQTPEYHRITRFRPNGIPVDGPGHDVYLRDDETGDYWTISWQPVGKPMDNRNFQMSLYAAGSGIAAALSQKMSPISVRDG